MTSSRVTTHRELLAHIEHSWEALQRLLERLTPAQQTILQDAQGWTVRDHILHLLAWERSAVFALQGRPRYVGLAVPAELYRAGDDDAINAAIYQQTRHLAYAEALAQSHAVHHQLLDQVKALTDVDLQRLYQEEGADDQDEDAGRPLLDLIVGNTSHHFAEHQAWIEALIRPQVQAMPRPLWTPLPYAGCHGVEAKALLRLERLSLALLRFQPGGTIHEHAAPMVIDVICLEGQGMTSLEGEAAPLQAGEWVRWPAGVRHRLWSEGALMVTLMVEHTAGASSA